jgi:hypothetical protein
MRRSTLPVTLAALLLLLAVSSVTAVAEGRTHTKPCCFPKGAKITWSYTGPDVTFSWTAAKDCSAYRWYLYGRTDLLLASGYVAGTSVTVAYASSPSAPTQANLFRVESQKFNAKTGRYSGVDKLETVGWRYDPADPCPPLSPNGDVFLPRRSHLL